MKLRRSDKSPLIFHLSLFIMASIIILFLTMRITPEEQEKYRQIMEEALSEQMPKEYQAKQQRSDIHRELLMTHKDSRTQTRLTAKRGILVLNQDANKPGFTEYLEGIACMMQEELYYQLPNGREFDRLADGSFVSRNKKTPLPHEEIAMLAPMQTIRYIQANEASLDYRTNLLKTKQMSFARYSAPGHELPLEIEGLSPELVGTAISAEVTFKDSGPEFHAKQLQVNIPNARVP